VRRVTYRLALVTAAATLVLIVFGGLVTNTGAALAVPDWPTTFGHNMFLYPWSAMVGGIFYEHSHRLIGSLVGILTLVLAAACWRHGGLVRRLGLIAVVAVITQGLLGGFRVVFLQETLAILHGCLAQAFFGLITVIAFLSSPSAHRPAAPVAPSLRTLTQIGAGLVYLQIVFGAFLTHQGRLLLHLTGAVLVMVVVPIVTARARRSGDAVMATTGRVLLAAVGVQLLLGIGSYLVRFTPVAIPGGQLTALALPVAHRVAGSLLLAGALLLALRTMTSTPMSATRGATVIPFAAARRVRAETTAVGGVR